MVSLYKNKDDNGKVSIVSPIYQGYDGLNSLVDDAGLIVVARSIDSGRGIDYIDRTGGAENHSSVTVYGFTVQEVLKGKYSSTSIYMSQPGNINSEVRRTSFDGPKVASGTTYMLFFPKLENFESYKNENTPMVLAGGHAMAAKQSDGKFIIPEGVFDDNKQVTINLNDVKQ